MLRLISCFLFFIFSLSAFAIDVKTYIPANAKIYIPLVKQQTEQYFPELIIPWYMGSLIEQESCIYLTHKLCWNPKSSLKTSREEGAGLGQLTKAYTKDGKIRFDSLEAIKQKHDKELKELSWSNVYTRPDLQIRTMVLMSRDNFKALYMIKDFDARTDMMDAAYNEGLGGVQADRRLCSLSKNCNPQIWFGNVEKTCSRSKKPIYDNRSACDISREHVHSGKKVRLEKYKKLFE